MRTIYFLDYSEKDWRGYISLQLGYQQTDFDFNESVWEEIREEVKNFFNTWGGKNTKKILEIPL